MIQQPSFTIRVDDKKKLLRFLLPPRPLESLTGSTFDFFAFSCPFMFFTRELEEL
jgi:hypothetical protein